MAAWLVERGSNSVVSWMTIFEYIQALSLTVALYVTSRLEETVI